MKFSFCKEYSNFTLDGDDHLNLTMVESKGEDINDLMANALIYLEDWHGNEGPEWDLGSLSNNDQELIRQDIMDFLVDAIARMQEEAWENEQCEHISRNGD